MTPASRSESAAHRELKALSLAWAHQQQFRIAATEVSLPNRGVRIDVAAYKTQSARKSKWNERLQREQSVQCPAIGATAIFECKVSKPDFRRDARSAQMTQERLRALHARKLRIEEELKIFYPSIRNGDSLFPEFETLNFERPGYERYQKAIAEIRQLTNRLYLNTKFDRLAKYGSANLYYVVAEPGVLSLPELPVGWGLLQRAGEELELIVKPIWHDVSEDDRLNFLHRVAMAGTRAVQRETGISWAPLKSSDPQMTQIPAD